MLCTAITDPQDTLDTLKQCDEPLCNESKKAVADSCVCRGFVGITRDGVWMFFGYFLAKCGGYSDFLPKNIHMLSRGVALLARGLW